MVEEHVIIVDDSNSPIGTREKREVHGEQTALHRGFSVFVFDHQGRFLLQQRSGSKQTWPLVWSNSCCGHPQPEENPVAAVQRRLWEELRISNCVPHEIVPDYRYKAVFNGIMENEFCPVWVAWYSGGLEPNAAEVANVEWIDWQPFIATISGSNDHPYKHFSCWCLEEAILIAQSHTFGELWDTHVT